MVEEVKTEVNVSQKENFGEFLPNTLGLFSYGIILKSVSNTSIVLLCIKQMLRIN